MHRQLTIPAWTLLLALTASAQTTTPPAQTQSFNVGQWFFGKNVTTDLPTGVTDLTDNMWGSEGHSCPIVIIGGKASLVCRDNVAGGPYTTVITEGDPHLGNIGRLAIPTTSGPTGNAKYGRYISSVVRPGPTNLYFTTLVPSTTNVSGFIHEAAFRVASYTGLPVRVAGAGDAVTINRTDLPGTPTMQATLTAAGPMDQNSDGREFIYIESTSSNFYALCELVSPGVFNVWYAAPLNPYMIDTPWGMGGFTFDHTQDHGGLIINQATAIRRVDLLLQGGAPNPYTIATNGCVPAAPNCPSFPPLPQTFVPNLLLSSFFRSSVEMNSFFLSWGNIPAGTINQLAPTPPQFLQEGISPLPDGSGWTSIYASTVGASTDTALGTFAASGNLQVAGVLPFGTASSALTKGTAAWPIQSLLYNATGAGWTSVLTNATLPDVSNGPKALYQGVTAHSCELEFATKQNAGATDGSGAFYALYRLFRPCPTSAALNTTTRTLVVQGINLADTATAVYLVAPGSTTMQGPYTVTSATATEVDATVPSYINGSQVVIEVDGAVLSDPINMSVTVQAAPILADLTDINGQHSNPVALKLMTLWGAFGCQTASTQTVNYPSTLGNCTVNFQDGSTAPMLYASNGQINILLPGTLKLGANQVTVTRADANGSFTSGAFVFNVFADGPVEFYSQTNVIVQVVRGGQAILIGPSDPIHPGEYFTFYVTGVNAQSLPTSVTLGPVNASFAQAFVVWAQGLLQVNVLVPPGTGPNPTVTFGDAPPFNITVQ